MGSNKYETELKNIVWFKTHKWPVMQESYAASLGQVREPQEYIPVASN